MKSLIAISIAVILAICATGALGDDWNYDGIDDLYEDGYGRGGYYGGASVYPSYAYGQQGVGGYGGYPAAGGLGFGAGYAVGNNNGGGIFGGGNGCKFRVKRRLCVQIKFLEVTK